MTESLATVAGAYQDSDGSSNTVSVICCGLRVVGTCFCVRSLIVVMSAKLMSPPDVSMPCTCVMLVHAVMRRMLPVPVVAG